MADLSNFIQQGLSTANFQNVTSLRSAAGAPSSNPTSVIDQQAPGAISGGSGLLRFPADTPKYYFTLGIANYSLQSLNAVGSAQVNQLLVLPLPLNLKDVHDENYWEYEYGMIAGAGSELAGNEGLAATAAAPGINNVVPGKIEQTERVVLGPGGYAPNEYYTLLYRGPKFKRPLLQWHLLPRNFGESAQIKAIVNAIQRAMHPKREAGGLLYHFPNIFFLAFNPNSGWLYKFKPAVITHAEFDWGKSFYRGASASNGDNPPESLRMTLHFEELEYWLTDDFNDESNNPLSGNHTSTGNLTQTFNNDVQAVQNQFNQLIQGVESLGQTNETQALQNLQTGLKNLGF